MEKRVCKHTGCSNPTRSPDRWECNICAANLHDFGITGPQREAILREQNYKCKCCSSPINFTGGKSGTSKYSAVIDHRENPFKIRRILCGACNVAIGKLGDTPTGVRQALRYLEVNHGPE